MVYLQGRGDLTVSYAQIIKELKPKYFVMENVDRLVKTNKYNEALIIFKNSGYGVTTLLLDASYFGVPQARKRFFVVGAMDEKDGFLDYYINKRKSDKQTTVRDYLGDSLQTDYYYRHPRNYNRRGIFSIDEPSPTVRGVNRPIPSGYKLHPSDPMKDISKVRALTTIERSYIQTFPKDFKFSGSKTDLEQLIGNAVPVKLAQVVAESLLEYINSPDKVNSRMI